MEFSAIRAKTNPQNTTIAAPTNTILSSNVQKTLLLVTKVARTGEDHREAMLVAGGDDFVVAS